MLELSYPTSLLPASTVGISTEILAWLLIDAKD